jgi:hypothetical protein
MRLRELIIGIVVATGTWTAEASYPWATDVSTGGRTP